MYKNKTILALIPARGGSKGIPRKNIRALAGKPLIAWTIGEARRSRYLDKIIVSTDDRRIAEVAKRYKAEVPFMRPRRLATDRAKVIDAILHATSWVERSGRPYDLVLLLQPTSPLRTSDDIDNAIKLFFDRKAKSVVSVCEVDHPPHWSNILPKNRRMGNFIRNVDDKNRQDLRAFYRVNGAIYLAYAEHLKKTKNFLGRDAYAYIMPRERSIDIDGEIDLKFAGLLLKEREAKSRKADRR